MADQRVAIPVRLTALRRMGPDRSSRLFRSLAASVLALVIAAPIIAAEMAYPLYEAPFAGRLIRSDSEWNLHFHTGDKVRVLPARELAYYGSYRDVEAGPQVILIDGSLIRSDVLLVDEEQVVLGDATGLGRGQWEESALPRSAVRAIMLQPPAGRAERDKLVLELMSESLPGASESARSEDLLLLVGGESVAGTLLTSPPGGRFESEKPACGEQAFSLLRRGAAEPLAIAAQRVVAVRFGSADDQTLPADASSVWLGLRDGSLIYVRSLSVKGDELSLSLVAGGRLLTTVSGRYDPEQSFWDAVTYVRPTNSRVVWLSDLTPVGYKHIPFVSVELPYGRDRNVHAARLRVDNAVIPKGLGMPSASRLAYEVTGYRKFEAELAIDERAGLEGSAVFKVLLESAGGQWQLAYESPAVRGGDQPLPVSVALQGASRMALLVDFGDRGDVRDYANWLHARLTKSAEHNR